MEEAKRAGTKPVREVHACVPSPTAHMLPYACVEQEPVHACVPSPTAHGLPYACVEPEYLEVHAYVKEDESRSACKTYHVVHTYVKEGTYTSACKICHMLDKLPSANLYMEVRFTGEKERPAFGTSQERKRVEPDCLGDNSAANRFGRKKSPSNKTEISISMFHAKST